MLFRCWSDKNQLFDIIAFLINCRRFDSRRLHHLYLAISACYVEFASLFGIPPVSPLINLLTLSSGEPWKCCCHFPTFFCIEFFVYAVTPGCIFLFFVIFILEVENLSLTYFSYKKICSCWISWGNPSGSNFLMVCQKSFLDFLFLCFVIFIFLQDPW